MAVLVLIALLAQSVGDARIVNYSGIVRGATQKLVKEELNGQRDDALILRLDGIIDNLQTGRGGIPAQQELQRRVSDRAGRAEKACGAT